MADQKGVSTDRAGPSKKHGDDPRLHFAAKELAKAHNEINALEREVAEKNAMLRKELKKSDKKEGTVVSQQEELDVLHDILEEQKHEIDRLNNVVEKLSDHTPDQYQGYEDQVQDFLRAADNLRSSLNQQRPRFERISPPRQSLPAGLAPDTYGGRPVPTFYDRDGRPTTSTAVPTATTALPANQHQQLPHQYYNQQQQYGPPQPAQQPYGGGGPTVMPPGITQQQPPMSAAPQFAPQQTQSTPALSGGVGHQQAGPSGLTGSDTGGQPQVIQGFMGPDGQLYIPSDQPGAAALDESVIVNPAGRQRSRSTGDLHNVGFSTTPMAGSLMNQARSTTPMTPNSSHVIPTMMSTPITPEDSSGNVRGILKKGGGLVRSRSEEKLFCNVPEHHDLEDYIEKLQNKVRRLKTKLKDRGESYHVDDSKRVLFEDDVDKNTIRRLQAELEDRRAELEGLDLAIETQKQQLGSMRETEKVLLSQRKAARDELAQLRHGKSGRRDRRKAFLDGNLDYDPYESDFDYEYRPRGRAGGATRSEYLVQEIDCLEETLAKRRAELREADKLLQETELDLAAAQKEARSTIQQYDTAKEGYRNTMRDTGEIEKRAYDAGVKLINTEERVASVEQQFRQLQEARSQQQQLLKQVQQIVSGKDEEFTNLKLEISKAEQRLAEVKAELSYAESQQENKLALMKESERLIQERQQEMDEYKTQFHKRRDSLRSLDAEISKKHRELESVEGTLEKRGGQLKAVSRQVELEVQRKRTDIQEERELQRLRSESVQKTAEIDEIRLETHREKEHLDGLTNQRKALEGAVDKLRSDKTAMEVDVKRLLNSLRDLNMSKSNLEDTIEKNEWRLSRLDKELSEVEGALGQNNMVSSLERELLASQDRGSELEAARDVSLGGQLERRECESLESRVRRLATELQSQHHDKTELADALNRSYKEIQNLRKQLGQERKDSQRRHQATDIETNTLQRQLHDRDKEIAHLREKAARDASDLEGVAQAHASRANRLSDELSYLRAEYMEVKRRLDSQKDLAERDKEIGETIRQLKSDLTYELKGESLNPDKTQTEAMTKLDEMHDQKQSLQRQVESVRNSLYHIRSAENEDTQHSFAEHQKMLKEQIQQRMSRQAEVLQVHKQQSQLNIQSLQNKLSSLEQALSQVENKQQVLTPLSDAAQTVTPLSGKPSTPTHMYEIVASAKEALRSLSPVRDDGSVVGYLSLPEEQLIPNRERNQPSYDAFHLEDDLPVFTPQLNTAKDATALVTNTTTNEQAALETLSTKTSPKTTVTLVTQAGFASTGRNTQMSSATENFGGKIQTSTTDNHFGGNAPTSPPVATKTSVRPSRIPTPTAELLSTLPKASGNRLGSKDSGIMVDFMVYNDLSSEDSESPPTVSHIPRPRHAYSPNRHSNKSRSRSGSRNKLDGRTTNAMRRNDD